MIHGLCGTLAGGVLVLSAHKRMMKMRIANLRIENFRGVRSGFVRFGGHPVLVGDNNSGKTTLIEALTLVLGRDRLIRDLSEHGFFGSNPQAADRIKIVATVTDFPGDDPEQSSQWFRDERAVVKWLDETTGQVHPVRNNPEWKLCCQLGVHMRGRQCTRTGQRWLRRFLSLSWMRPRT